MPLVRLDVPVHLPEHRIRGLADAVHVALVATANVPEADRFHVITRHAAPDLVISPDFLDIDRSREAAIIQVIFRQGRTPDQKRALYRMIAAGAAEAGFRPEDVMVVLTENTLPDWSFGRGIAQYAPG